MRKVVYTAMWIAVGIALAYIFHLITLPDIAGIIFTIGTTVNGNIISSAGRIFLPLHLVAMLAGASSGAVVGGLTGALLPLLSFLTTGMPPFPMFLFMMPEVFCYGFLLGILKRWNIFLRLAIAIVAGRAVYSLAYYTIGALLNIKLQPLNAILLSFTTGIPGIVLQFVLVPLVYKRLQSVLMEKGGEEHG